MNRWKLAALPINIKSREAYLKKLGYDLHYEKPELARGGVGLMVKEKYKTIARTDLKIHKKKIKGQELEVENIWHEIKNNNDKTLAVIGVIYKHPGTSVDCLEYFNRSIVKIAEKVNNEGKQCIITGDLNMDGLKIDQNQHVKTSSMASWNKTIFQ